jgi:hypothetical protein
MAQNIVTSIRLDDYREGSLELRGVDLTNELVPLNDTITSVDEVAVTSRDDGATLGVDDLQIVTTPGPPFLDGTMRIGFWLSSSETLVMNGVSLAYYIRVKATTQMQRMIIVDAQILVLPHRG